MSRYQGDTIAVATIDDGKPVDLDIDGDNDNGSDLPDGSEREEDLEIEGGFGKIVFVNHDDDDGDGIPDYADLENPDEDNLVPVVLKIDLPDVFWDEVEVVFDVFGFEQPFDPEPSEIEMPGDPPTATEFLDYRGTRGVVSEGGEMVFPTFRLWRISDPAQTRTMDDLILANQVYTRL